VIEQRGKVVEVEDGLVWVSYVRQTACQSCKSESVCGNSYMEKWASGKITHIPALNSLTLKTGDEVVIGIDEHAVLKASVFVYAMPILFLLAGAVVGNSLSANDLGSGVGGLLGLAAGFLGVHLHSLFHRHNSQYSPVVLREAGAQNVTVQFPS